MKATLIYNKSCEMMADDIASYIMAHYPGRDLTVEVSEDGENGAICFYERDSNLEKTDLPDFLTTYASSELELN